MRGGEEVPTLNFDVIPPWVAERIAEQTLEAVCDFLDQPGGAEFLEKQAEKFRLEDERRKA